MKKQLLSFIISFLFVLVSCDELVSEESKSKEPDIDLTKAMKILADADIARKAESKIIAEIDNLRLKLSDIAKEFTKANKLSKKQHEEEIKKFAVDNEALTVELKSVIADSKDRTPLAKGQKALSNGVLISKPALAKLIADYKFNLNSIRHRLVREESRNKAKSDSADIICRIKLTGK